MRPRLALVPGEPAGVGPELCVRLAQRGARDAHGDTAADLVALADPDTLLAAADALGLPLALRDADAPWAPGSLPLHPIPLAHRAAPGTPDAGNARAVIDALLLAGQGALEGRWAGVVTGPVHKASINAGGIAYTGTTELLAAQAGVEVVMLLANPRLRVALATTHLPLRAVPDALTRGGVARTLGVLADALRRDFGLERPRIAVLGLNPHAGEDGVLGREEIDVIAPAMADAAAARPWAALLGPLPADTAFLPGKLAGYDAVLAMYHDQGLPVLKHSGFEDAVNATLGLPYPRVAVDHGTALDLAGRGVADPSSLFHAADLCAALARRAGAAARAAR
jgi:4-hydroxythreonine-4-phosphate dehydrogenase